MHYRTIKVNDHLFLASKLIPTSLTPSGIAGATKRFLNKCLLYVIPLFGDLYNGHKNDWPSRVEKTYQSHFSEIYDLTGEMQMT